MDRETEIKIREIRAGKDKQGPSPMNDEELGALKSLRGDIRNLVDRVDDFFEGDDEKVLSWFVTENPFLAASPVSLILAGKTKRIIEMLDDLS